MASRACKGWTMLLLAFFALGCGNDHVSEHSHNSSAGVDSSRGVLYENTITLENRNRELANQIRDKTVDSLAKRAILEEILIEGNNVKRIIHDDVQVMNRIAELDSSTGEFLNVTETHTNFLYWLRDENCNGGRGNGEAIRLAERLNSYCDYANVIACKLSAIPCDEGSPTMFEHIAKEVEGEDWEHGTFARKPVIANLAMLEKLEMDVLEIEWQLLRKLAASLP